MTYGLRAMALLATIGVSGAASATDARAQETYQADPVHSSVVFRVKHMNTSYFWGRFNDLSGTFSLDSADPAKSKLQFQVKAASVDTGNAKRDQHLKSPDFFNAAENPKLTFKSKEVKAGSAGKWSVTGDLTIHGVTKPLTCDVEMVGTADSPQMGARAGFETTFTIKREDFGMKNMIGDSANRLIMTALITTSRTTQRSRNKRAATSPRLNGCSSSLIS